MDLEKRHVLAREEVEIVVSVFGDVELRARCVPNPCAKKQYRNLDPGLDEVLD
jgi:disulfide oxidoreductase YuzD